MKIIPVSLIYLLANVDFSMLFEIQHELLLTSMIGSDNIAVSGVECVCGPNALECLFPRVPRMSLNAVALNRLFFRGPSVSLSSRCCSATALKLWWWG